LPNHSEPGTAASPEAGDTQAKNEASMQESSVMPGQPYPTYHGRKVSWVAVSIMVIGFVVGGLGLIVGGHGGPLWWLFWTGAGIAVLGLLIAVATNTFEDWY
jgi:hypothetical protein